MLQSVSLQLAYTSVKSNQSACSPSEVHLYIVKKSVLYKIKKLTIFNAMLSFEVHPHTILHTYNK